MADREETLRQLRLTIAQLRVEDAPIGGIARPEFVQHARDLADLAEELVAEVWTPVSKETATAVIGEGLHTGLRKGTDAPDAHKMWKMISDSETSAWSDAVDFLVWGLDYMGMAICKKEKGES